jgi:CDP-glucose 4,6-dehydratase
MVKSRFWKGKRILITGHTGFKGAWLTVWLRVLGADVVGYSLLPLTVPSHYELAEIEEGITVVEADVRDFETLRKAVQTYYATNIMGTAHLLEAVRQVKGVKAVVNVTSDKCYENREWIWGYRESDPMGGYDPYSSSKGCAELVTSGYLRSFFNPDEYEKHGVGLASVRAGNVIGGGDFAQDRLIPDLVRAFEKVEPVHIRSPHATRPWQHVLEPLSGYLLLAEKLYEDGPAYAGAWNFGPLEDDVKEVGWIVEHFVKSWGKDAKWEVNSAEHPHEAGMLKLDCSKARMLLNWRPRLNIEEALAWSVKWYKAYVNQPNSLRRVTEQQIEEYENRSHAA